MDLIRQEYGRGYSESGEIGSVDGSLLNNLFNQIVK